MVGVIATGGTIRPFQGPWRSPGSDHAPAPVRPGADESAVPATSPVGACGTGPHRIRGVTVVDEQDVRGAVVAERRSQVELYESLTDEQWRAPSLCSGWSVHELLAHTTMPFRYSLPRVLVEVVRARGDFDRMADRRARADAVELTPEQLVASLRDNVEHPWAPPGGGPLGALSHDVIHGLDAAAALGRDDHASPERVALVLSGMRPRHLAGFGVDLTGVELRATDADWSHGSGDVVRGRAQDLLLVLCGRPVRAERLEGDAVTRLASVRA